MKKLYDDENRLLYFTYTESGTPLNPSDPPVGSGDLMSEFHYDGFGRLRERIEYTNDTYYGTGWAVGSDTRYIYDGWRVIQERDGSDTPDVSYTRGPDLSGTLEGAGGIGGLLARSSGYSGGNWTSHAYYHADGNGNITSLIDASQNVVASYRYDPYGNTVSQSGTLADANIYRFSSKEIHTNSVMYYYGYRFYEPGTQRWINRDPDGEAGGYNLYQPFGNDPLDDVDPFGLDDKKPSPDPAPKPKPPTRPPQAPSHPPPPTTVPGGKRSGIIMGTNGVCYLFGPLGPVTIYGGLQIPQRIQIGKPVRGPGFQFGITIPLEHPKRKHAQ